MADVGTLKGRGAGRTVAVVDLTTGLAKFDTQRYTYDPDGNEVSGASITNKNPGGSPAATGTSRRGSTSSVLGTTTHSAGRWTQPDLTGQDANPYLYVGVDPLNFVDPDGRSPFDAVGRFFRRCGRGFQKIGAAGAASPSLTCPLWQLTQQSRSRGRRSGCCGAGHRYGKWRHRSGVLCHGLCGLDTTESTIDLANLLFGSIPVLIGISYCYMQFRRRGQMHNYPVIRGLALIALGLAIILAPEQPTAAGLLGAVFALSYVATSVLMIRTRHTGDAAKQG